MKQVTLIGVAGFAGGVLRYLLSVFIQTKFSGPLPVGTLSVNIVGCLLAGFLMGLSDKLVVSTDLKLFVAVGFLGGFTTFSAFSVETISLFRDGRLLLAFLYILTSVILCLLSACLGFIVSRIIV